MKGSQAIKASLEELAATLEQVDRTLAVQTLRKALATKSNSVVEKAASLAGRLKAEELVPDLCAAFERFMGTGMPSDKFCLAKTGIVKALHQLGTNQPAVFLAAMTCYWPAQPRARQRDEAVALRIEAAAAHAELGSQSDLDPIVSLLVDPVSDVRHAAVRALVALGGQAAPLLLRLKTLTGDDNASVMDACFSGLMELDGDRHVPFVASFLESEDDRVRVAAAIAIGESGHKKALEILTSSWKRAEETDFSRVLLVAIALLRNDQAMHFLLSLIESGGGSGAEALTALVTYRSIPEVTRQVEEAVGRAGDDDLQRLFEAKFRKLH